MLDPSVSPASFFRGFFVVVLHPVAPQISHSATNPVSTTKTSNQVSNFTKWVHQQAYLPVAHITIQPTKGRKLVMTILNTTHLCTLLPGSLCFWCNRLCKVWQSKRGGAGAAPCLGSHQHWAWAVSSPRRKAQSAFITTCTQTHTAGNTGNRDQQREHWHSTKSLILLTPVAEQCTAPSVRMHNYTHLYTSL